MRGEGADGLVVARMPGNAGGAKGPESVLEAIRDRFAQCRLELHPGKTRIVYCKDDDRRGEHEHIQFDFLGYRGNKVAVQVIVERSKKVDGVVIPGQVQSISLGSLGPEEKVDGRTVGAKLRTHTDPDTTILMTDESRIYTRVGENFKEHHTVNHSKEEYVREDPDGHLVHTNTAEGFNANLKRQINGSHHHVSKKHLPKYLEEHDYKYNTRDQTDGARTVAAIRNMEGKRLTLYKPESGKGASLICYKASEPGGKKGGGMLTRTIARKSRRNEAI